MTKDLHMMLVRHSNNASILTEKALDKINHNPNYRVKDSDFISSGTLEDIDKNPLSGHPSLENMIYKATGNGVKEMEELGREFFNKYVLMNNPISYKADANKDVDDILYVSIYSVALRTEQSAFYFREGFPVDVDIIQNKTRLLTFEENLDWKFLDGVKNHDEELKIMWEKHYFPKKGMPSMAVEGFKMMSAVKLGIYIAKAAHDGYSNVILGLFTHFPNIDTFLGHEYIEFSKNRKEVRVNEDEFKRVGGAIGYGEYIYSKLNLKEKEPVIEVFINDNEFKDYSLKQLEEIGNNYRKDMMRIIN